MEYRKFLVVIALCLSGQLVDAACDHRYRDPTAGTHSMCLSTSSHVLDSGVTNAEKQEIVNRHNWWRKSVDSSNMVEVSWDDEIAAIAQKWAENCVWDHDDSYNRYNFGVSSVGQNIYYSTSNSNWTHAIDRWGDEVNDFVYGGSAADQGGSVGHYTQIMWAETYKVGCGYAHCSGKPYNFFVCNYSPAGNNHNTKYTPYKKGTDCHDCPHHCSNGLCDYNGKFCHNGGTMDLATGACTCHDYDYFTASDICALDCSAGQDYSRCGNGYVTSFADCRQHSSSTYRCPKYCKICPAFTHSHG